jgi:hypothetical protein
VKKHLKGRSLFQLIDQKLFNALVKKWDMDKWVQSFSTREMTRGSAIKLNLFVCTVEAILPI